MFIRKHHCFVNNIAWNVYFWQRFRSSTDLWRYKLYFYSTSAQYEYYHNQIHYTILRRVLYYVIVIHFELDNS